MVNVPQEGFRLITSGLLDLTNRSMCASLAGKDHTALLSAMQCCVLAGGAGAARRAWHNATVHSCNTAGMEGSPLLSQRCCCSVRAAALTCTVVQLTRGLVGVEMRHFRVCSNGNGDLWLLYGQLLSCAHSFWVLRGN